MWAFLLRRLLHAVFVTWGVVTVVFFLVRLTGDPTLFLVDQSATQEEIAHTRALLGLDRPLAVQYVDFLGAALRGDFGASIREKRPAMNSGWATGDTEPRGPSTPVRGASARSPGRRVEPACRR